MRTELRGQSVMRKEIHKCAMGVEPGPPTQLRVTALNVSKGKLTPKHKVKLATMTPSC